MGGHSGAAAVRLVIRRPHQINVGHDRPSVVLDLLRRHGTFAGIDFLVFTGTSIARTFFIAAAMFGATSLYGYTTRRDLSSIGSFLIMGLIGVVIASLVNLFIVSNALQSVVSVVGIIVFVGLTA